MEGIHKGCPMEDSVALTCKVFLEGKKSTPLDYVHSTNTARLSLCGQKALLACIAIINIIVVNSVNIVPPKSPYV